jgi:cell division protein FtsZ
MVFELETTTEPIDLTPTMVEHEQVFPAILPVIETPDEKEEGPVFYEISSSVDQTPIVAFDIPQPIPTPEKKTVPVAKATAPVVDKTAEAAKTVTPAAAGYLVKPAQIYAAQEESKAAEQKTVEKTVEEKKAPLQVQLEEEEVFEMQMVLKPASEDKDENMQESDQPITMEMAAPDAEAPQDETDELKRRAMERISKLRNLSFNINAADPNNEFETVPAYLRRNMEIHNQIADVESFYSNYTVKSNENNQAEISTINTFLDGKKPD